MSPEYSIAPEIWVSSANSIQNLLWDSLRILPKNLVRNGVENPIDKRIKVDCWPSIHTRCQNSIEIVVGVRVWWQVQNALGDYKLK